ncbi:unnamed protein product, partial [Amoebophrya sp. A120]|eukprot:GSA120T00023424001.1
MTFVVRTILLRSLLFIDTGSVLERKEDVVLENGAVISAANLLLPPSSPSLTVGGGGHTSSGAEINKAGTEQLAKTRGAVLSPPGKQEHGDRSDKQNTGANTAVVVLSNDTMIGGGSTSNASVSNKKTRSYTGSSSSTSIWQQFALSRENDGVFHQNRTTPDIQKANKNHANDKARLLHTFSHKKLNSDGFLGIS